MRFAVFGDIGGHRELFETALLDIGCDVEAGRTPEDTCIVQVGDLIDRGPDSDGVVELVNRFIRGENWFQLAGNHETNHLGGPQFTTPGSLSEASKPTIGILKEWWRKGHMRVGLGLGGNGEHLITHSGLHRQFWINSLGSNTNLHRVINVMNNQKRRMMASGGMLQTNRAVAAIPGPMWAHCRSELYPSWSGHAMPWDQIHGHSTIYPWSKIKTAEDCAKFTGVGFDFEKRHSAIQIGDVDPHYIIQVDPGYGAYSGFVPQPYWIEGVTDVSW